MTDKKRCGYEIIIGAALCVAVACGGCGGGQKKEGLISRLSDVTMSEAQLQARIDDFVFRFMGLTELAADRIYHEANDSDTRQRALFLAIRSNEEAVRAATISDPLASMVDMWVLCAQLRQFVTTGHAAEYFGEFQHLIIDALTELEAEAAALAEELAGEEAAQRGRDFVERWVETHPLTGEFSRTSTLREWATFSEDSYGGLFEVALTLDQSVNNISARLDILNEQLPKQIIWRLMLFLEERLGNYTVPLIMAEVERGLVLAEQIPTIVDEQREAATQSLHTERVEILQEVDRQRLETLQSIQTVADDALEQVEQERLAIQAAIDTALADTFEVVRQERDVTLEAINAMVAAKISAIESITDAKIDYAFRKAYQMAGLAALAIVVLLAVLRLRPARAAR